MGKIEMLRTDDLIDQALNYQDEVMADLFHNIIMRSDKAEAYSALRERANVEGIDADRQQAYLECIQLANTIIAQYITREF